MGKIQSGLVLLLFLVLPIASGLASSVPEEALRIQQAYEHIKDIKGTFIQKGFIKDLKKTHTYKGNFFIKRPSKMRWSYKEQEILINNNEILIYEKQKKQAIKSRFDRKTYGQTPVALLSGFADITSEFEITKKDDVLLLKPKAPMAGVSFIKIEASSGNFPIKSFTVTDTYSNTVEIILSDVEINTGINESIFELQLPQGVSVYEYNP